MPAKEIRQRRKELKQQVRQEERAQFESSLPVAADELQLLVDHLEVALETGCDHTLKLTQVFLQERDLELDQVLPWLLEQGGGCDCEVLANVEERFA